MPYKKDKKKECMGQYARVTYTKYWAKVNYTVKVEFAFPLQTLQSGSNKSFEGSAVQYTVCYQKQ